MAIGVMPVTGIPLPFLSHGGSFMITNLAAIGLILSVQLRRENMLF
jgi:rod shape determining protein RodA